MGNERTNQKTRTRRELLAAARRLADRGQSVTVDAVADEAQVHRATAYRYFSDPATLTLEMMLDEQFASPEAVVGEASDVRERVHRVQRYLFTAIRESESRFRIFLARALDNSAGEKAGEQRQVRGARRLPMYEHALAPVRPLMSRPAFDFLVLSLSAASGLEAYIALKDICQVDDTLADRIATSNIDAILDKLLPAQG